MPDWQAINKFLERDHDIVVDAAASPRSVGGGDINAAWRIETATGPAFLKTARAASFDMFSAEADGLSELKEANAIRVPDVLGFGRAEDDAYLALEWLQFAPAGRAEEHTLGQQLAAQHRVTSERFGWHRDNTIGLTHQPNEWCANWVRFFRKQRLDHQLALAKHKGYGGELQAAGRRLSSGLDSLFDNYEPVPSLLHGDLWSGNWSGVEGEPVIFDPAVYYGDRESDIAMTRLFGGFGEQFYSAYEEQWPMSEGSEQRCRLYQLYHVLNHLNLFGRSYLGRSLQLMRSLLAI